MVSSSFLDTSIVIAVFRKDAAAERLVSGGAQTFLPVPALGELYTVVPRSSHPDLALAQLRAFVDTLRVVDCDAETARIYGGIRHSLLTKGRPIPENDIWIAAICLDLNVPLLTRDAHFDQVPGLQVVRW